MSEPTRAYPEEIAAIVRKQTFFINSYLSVAKSNDGYGNAPLMMYGHFSRYRMHIINKDRKIAYANISVQAMRALIELSRVIYPEYVKSTVLSAPAKASSADTSAHTGYTATFASGTYKGMTPAQVLLRDGDEALDPLRSQYKFLRDHLDKYPRNQAIMDAITDAVSLFKDGKLSADETSSGAGKSVVLYDAQLRPLVRMKREDGKSFIYNCKITWDFGAKSPITIAIENYYAPVNRLNDGRLNVMAAQRDNTSVISNVMNLTADEWIWCITQIEMDMRRFETINAQSTWTDAKRTAAAQRSNALNAPSDTSQDLPVLPRPESEYPERDVPADYGETEYSEPEFDDSVLDAPVGYSL